MISLDRMGGFGLSLNSKFSNEYDITMEIFQGMEVYKNREEKQPVIEVVSDFSNAEVYESKLSMNLHTGTHIDASKHIFPDGKDSSLFFAGSLEGTALVLDCSAMDGPIGRDSLLSCDNFGEASRVDFVLIKTANSHLGKEREAFAYLALDGAKLLATLGLKGVGIDALGIERSQPGHPTHKELMNSDVMIIEGLALDKIIAKKYYIKLFPMKIRGVEALPAVARLYD